MTGISFGKMNAACDTRITVHGPMFTRILLIFALVLSPLALPAADSRAVKMPACAAMVCVKPCCASMVCCAAQPQRDPAPAQAPAPSRGGIEQAVIAAHTFSFLYALPAPERRFVIRDEALAAHTLPPLAATCIRLI